MVIYFIQRASDKAIKIGFSYRLRDRMYGIKAEARDSLEILCIIDGGRPRETSLHKQFSESRLDGEWFSPCKSLLEYISSLKDESIDWEKISASTLIKMAEETKARIANFGKAGESLETAIIRALDKAEKYDKEHS